MLMLRSSPCGSARCTDGQDFPCLSRCSRRRWWGVPHAACAAPWLATPALPLHLHLTHAALHSSRAACQAVHAGTARDRAYRSQGLLPLCAAARMTCGRNDARATALPDKPQNARALQQR